MTTPVELWARLPRWARAALTFLDRFANARSGGLPAETVTYRLAQARARGERAGIVGCALLEHFDPGHCDRALRFGAYGPPDV